MNPKKLKQLIDGQSKRIPQLEIEAGLQPRVLYSLINEDAGTKKPRRKTMEGLAKALGIPYEKFVALVSEQEDTLTITAWNPTLFSQAVESVLQNLPTHHDLEYNEILNIISELYGYSLPSNTVEKSACEMIIRLFLKSRTY